MKIALVHDYIKEYGGAERVLEALHEIWPDAPVYTSLYLPEYLGPHRERFRDWEIRESWARFLPFREKLISPLRIVAPLLFKSFDFSDFDVVIVSATGAYESNLIRIRNQESGIRRTVHVCYCHTPPRYLYGYATAREWKKNIVLRVFGELANHFLRIVDFNASKNVDHFIANSEEVRSRIKKFYRRDAMVIYPPVEVKSIQYKVSSIKQKKHTAYSIPNTEYYLAGGRLARPKNIDLIIKTCTKHKLPLKVFGKPFADYGEELKKIAGDLVEFVGEVTDEEKYELMRNAKAYIFASTDEDFGITPVEAMSVGTPVIAYKGGGVLETVIGDKRDKGDKGDKGGVGQTGVFFEELSEDSLLKAIKKLERLKITAEDCIKQAEKFSKERFKTEIQLFIKNHASLK